VKRKPEGWERLFREALPLVRGVRLIDLAETIERLFLAEPDGPIAEAYETALDAVMRRVRTFEANDLDDEDEDEDLDFA
jgi:hypothetical protein